MADGERTLAAIVEAADRAMYEAKVGRNQVRLARPVVAPLSKPVL